MHLIEHRIHCIEVDFIAVIEVDHVARVSYLGIVYVVELGYVKVTSTWVVDVMDVVTDEVLLDDISDFRDELSEVSD